MTKRAQRLWAIGLIFTGLALATALTLYGLRAQVSFFYSPSDILGEGAHFTPPPRPFRLGGLVKDGSIEQRGLRVDFIITDGAAEIPVTYEGLLPSLFAEGQGAVATGTLSADKSLFTATQLLARHDENYMPPEVADSLKRSGYFREDGQANNKPYGKTNYGD